MSGQRQGRGVAGVLGMVLLVLVFGIGSSSVVADDRSGPGFRFDTGLGWSTMDQSFHTDARWSSGALVNVEEYWDFDFEGSGGITFGAAFFYRINPFISVEVEGRGLFTEPELTSDYAIYWDWDDGRSSWNAYQGMEEERSQMRTAVGSLNLVAHLTDRGPFRPFFSFGLSAFDTEIRGAYDTAYAFTYTSEPYQYLDFEYPVIDFEADANSMGFNAGAGGEMKLNRTLALILMVKYYHAESQEVSLRARGGSYPELNNLVMMVDPSFWVATGGISFTF